MPLFKTYDNGMRYRLILTLILAVFLTACAPKFNYVSTKVEQPAYDQILVVFDYLHVVDDVGKLLDYPADKNMDQINLLKTQIESALRAKGFKGDIDFALISSGLGLNPELGFEHYVDGDLQEQLIYPPFYLESPYHEAFQYQLIQSFADAQSVSFVPVSKENTDYFNDLRMIPLTFADSEEYLSPQLDDKISTAVLHIRAVWPRVSFMKAMGVSLLSVGLTAGVSGGAYVGIATPVGMPHSTGLLFDNATGEVIWKNQISGDLSKFGKQTKAKFFKDLPNFTH
jgi:hypothetical protein